MAVLQWRRKLFTERETFCRKQNCFSAMDSVKLASSRVSKIRSIPRAGSYLAGGPVQELTCGSRTRPERRLKLGNTVNWSHGAPTLCEVTGTIRKTRLSHFETECFARETSVIRIQTAISTFS